MDLLSAHRTRSNLRIEHLEAIADANLGIDALDLPDPEESVEEEPHPFYD